MVQGAIGITDLACDGVNGCFEYNPHSYLRKSLRWGGGNLVSSLIDGKSLTRKISLILSNAIFDEVGFMGFPNEIDR